MESPYSLRMCGLIGHERTAREILAYLDSLFDLCEEPPLRKVTEDGDSEDELAATDQRKTEECCTTHYLRVVEVPRSRLTT